MTATCRYYWGSHGCDLVAGHPGSIHECGAGDPEGLCCQYDQAADPDHRVRHTQGDGWTEWGPYGEGFTMADVFLDLYRSQQPETTTPETTNNPETLPPWADLPVQDRAEVALSLHLVKLLGLDAAEDRPPPWAEGSALAGLNPSPRALQQAYAADVAALSDDQFEQLCTRLGRGTPR